MTSLVGLVALIAALCSINSWASSIWRRAETCQVTNEVLIKQYLHHYNVHCSPLFDCKLPDCIDMKSDGMCCKKAINKICERHHYSVSVYNVTLMLQKDLATLQCDEDLGHDNNNLNGKGYCSNEIKSVFDRAFSNERAFSNKRAFSNDKNDKRHFSTELELPQNTLPSDTLHPCWYTTMDKTLHYGAESGLTLCQWIMYWSAVTLMCFICLKS